MTTLRIACVVEGHGDVEAVPVLVRRIAQVVDPALAVVVPQPIRVPRAKLIKNGECERAVELAARKVGPGGGILILVDADDDCPAELGPILLNRACKQRGDRAITVVLAKREFEAWFLAAAESLRGRRGLATDLTAPAEPEEVRGAKEWLGRQMAAPGGYTETLDQPKLAATFDLIAARSVPSFEKCHRAVVALVDSLRVPAQP